MPHKAAWDSGADLLVDPFTGESAWTMVAAVAEGGAEEVNSVAAARYSQEPLVVVASLPFATSSLMPFAPSCVLAPSSDARSL